MDMIEKIRRKLDQDGFTILEVMMGMVIFSIGLLTLLSMIVISIQGNSWSDKTTQVVQMVRQTIEEVKNTPYDDLEWYGFEETGTYFHHWYLEEDLEQANILKMTVYVYWEDEFQNPQYNTTTAYFQPKE
jgi:prepilin-type N-terminal cleavage/methylation domain-containing protein